MSKRPRRNHAPAFKAKVALDALKGEALLRRQAVVIGLLEQRLVGKRVAIVLVRRIARPMAAGRDHLDHQQAFSLLNINPAPNLQPDGWGYAPIPSAATPVFRSGNEYTPAAYQKQSTTAG